ncbi:MAG: pyruvate kinase [Alphaproteobacteria bacterium]|nr:pyruvate kinase [Alphaproteobacteria bacterium]OJV46452.1 MAG: pyruvate kinase [Alphaproteobacteria bacterium 43-37]
MRRRRLAKIVATLGPSSRDPETIEQLFLSGADTFRLNFSHGSHEDHQLTFEHIRQVEAKLNHPIGIMVDLQGPKLRIGSFQNDKIFLQTGQEFVFDQDLTLGTQERVCLPHPEIYSALKMGDSILLDDGLLKMEVLQNNHTNLIMKVIMGGWLSNRKGVNIPGSLLPLSALTAKDRVDLEFGLKLGADWIALSFVQKPEDIEEIKSIVNNQAGIIAKLEKPLAIEHLESIIALSDALMVARGDLGVEMPPEDVPTLQKRIIRACLRIGKPVIIATQMLDSMVRSPTPTRAEASDVATAVYDGVDAVMLSAESASGAYPVEAVKMMDRIIRRVEQDPFYRQEIDAHRYESGETTPDAITSAARHITQTIRASAIVTFTSSGSTTLSAARERPWSPILGITPFVHTARKLTLTWGVHPIFNQDIQDITDMVSTATRLAKEHGFSEVQDRIVITAGIPFGTPGKTNLLRIARVGIEVT